MRGKVPFSIAGGDRGGGLAKDAPDELSLKCTSGSVPAVHFVSLAMITR
ncbi:MAG: hypothetical protein GX883_10605 [Firmicutes bacterium]|nr:hypothetical protein [Bacillota bacterium]